MASPEWPWRASTAGDMDASLAWWMQASQAFRPPSSAALELPFFSALASAELPGRRRRPGLGLVVGSADLRPGRDSLEIQKLKTRTTLGQACPGSGSSTSCSSAPTAGAARRSQNQRLKPALQDEGGSEDQQQLKNTAAYINDLRRASVMRQGRSDALGFVPAAREPMAFFMGSRAPEEDEEDGGSEREALVVPDDVLLQHVKQGNWEGFMDYLAQHRLSPSQPIRFNANCSDGFGRLPVHVLLLQ